MATDDQEICSSEVSQPRLALQCILAQLSTDCICAVRLSLHMAPRLRLPDLMSHNLCSCTAIEITDWHECSVLASHVHRRVEKGVKGFNVRGNSQNPVKARVLRGLLATATAGQLSLQPCRCSVTTA